MLSAHHNQTSLQQTHSLPFTAPQGLLVMPFLFEVPLNLPFIKLTFSPLITAYQALSNANTEMYPATARLASRLSFCWNYGGLQSRNANPPVSCFSTTSHGMKSADYSGKKQTDLFPCQLATFKESKQCVVQEKEHPCESQGERQMGGSSSSAPASAHGCCLWEQGQPSHLCHRLCIS